MKKILLITLSILLAACGVVQPVQQELPTPIVQTVVVTVIAPTEIVLPTALSTATALPPTVAPTETLVPTLPPQPTEVLPTVNPATSNNSLVAVNVDNTLGKGVFTNITFTSDIVSLRCFPREMQISMTANLADIVGAVIYYRVIDNPAALYPSEWQNLGEMETDKKGNFFFTFKGETVHPNLRLDKAWIDFQFIGTNKGGSVVDRTQKIERLVTYIKDCP